MVQNWSGEFPRYSQDHYPDPRAVTPRDDGRYYDPSQTGRPQATMDVNEALRTYCGMDLKYTLVAGVTHEGEVVTTVAPWHTHNDGDESLFFNRARFKEAVDRVEQSGHISPAVQFKKEEHFQHRAFERRRLSPNRDEEWDGLPASARKRQRPQQYGRTEVKDIPMSVRQRKGLKIGDSQEVYKYYKLQFNEAQQNACKLVAKAWVKVVEPRKQTTHPYTKGDPATPAWWPKPWGPGNNDRVRHKEPDHQYKKERIHLLAHILRLAIEPAENQPAEIQALNLQLTVKKLEDAAWEALSGWLADSAANAAKRTPLEDLFRVAEKEERYKDGQLDEGTTLYVLVNEKKNHASDDNEDADDTGGEEDPLSPPKPARPSATPRADRTHQPGPLVGELPMRTASFAAPHSQMLSYMSQQPPSFNESSLPPLSQPTVNPTVHVEVGHPNASRRGSLFQDFPTPGGSSVFSGHWQPVSSAGTPNSVYAFPSQQQSNAASQPYTNTALPMPPAEHQGYSMSGFGVSHPGYDPNTAYRHPEMTPSAGNHHQTQSYAYTPPDGSDHRGHPPPPLDSEPRHHG